MEIGSKVFVNRQIGKDGVVEKTRGTIERFSYTITVKGKPTAVVVFEDSNDKYWFPIDEIEVIG